MNEHVDAELQYSRNWCTRRMTLTEKRGSTAKHSNVKKKWNINVVGGVLWSLHERYKKQNGVKLWFTRCFHGLFITLLRGFIKNYPFNLVNLRTVYLQYLSNYFLTKSLSVFESHDFLLYLVPKYSFMWKIILTFLLI